MTIEDNSIPIGYKFCECGDCNKLIKEKDDRGRPRRFKLGHVHKLYDLKKGSEAHGWRGGKPKHTEGYEWIWVPEGYPNRSKLGYILLHRYIYQEYYKCCLLKGIIVHHKDENKLNNSIDNLQPVTRGQHNKIHKNFDKLTEAKNKNRS